MIYQSLSKKELIDFVIKTYHYLDEVSCDTKSGEIERTNTDADMKVYKLLLERLVIPKINLLVETEEFKLADDVKFDYFVIEGNKLLLRFYNPDVYYTVAE